MKSQSTLDAGLAIAMYPAIIKFKHLFDQLALTYTLKETFNILKDFGIATDENVNMWVRLKSKFGRIPNTFTTALMDKSLDISAAIKIRDHLKYYYENCKGVLYSRQFILITIQDCLLLMEDAYKNQASLEKEAQFVFVYKLCGAVLKDRRSWEDHPTFMMPWNKEKEVQDFCNVIAGVQSYLGAKISKLRKECKREQLRISVENITYKIPLVIKKISYVLAHFTLNVKEIPEIAFMEEKVIAFFQDHRSTYRGMRSKAFLTDLLKIIKDENDFRIFQEYIYASKTATLLGQLNDEASKAQTTQLNDLVEPPFSSKTASDHHIAEEEEEKNNNTQLVTTNNYNSELIVSSPHTQAAKRNAENLIQDIIERPVFFKIGLDFKKQDKQTPLMLLDLLNKLPTIFKDTIFKQAVSLWLAPKRLLVNDAFKKTALKNTIAAYVFTENELFYLHQDQYSISVTSLNMISSDTAFTELKKNLTNNHTINQQNGFECSALTGDSIKKIITATGHIPSTNDESECARNYIKKLTKLYKLYFDLIRYNNDSKQISTIVIQLANGGPCTNWQQMKLFHQDISQNMNNLDQCLLQMNGISAEAIDHFIDLQKNKKWHNNSLTGQQESVKISDTLIDGDLGIRESLTKFSETLNLFHMAENMMEATVASTQLIMSQSVFGGHITQLAPGYPILPAMTVDLLRRAQQSEDLTYQAQQQQWQLMNNHAAAPQPRSNAQITVLPDNDSPISLEQIENAPIQGIPLKEYLNNPIEQTLSGDTTINIGGNTLHLANDGAAAYLHTLQQSFNPPPPLAITYIGNDQPNPLPSVEQAFSENLQKLTGEKNKEEENLRKAKETMLAHNPANYWSVTLAKPSLWWIPLTLLVVGIIIIPLAYYFKNKPFIKNEEEQYKAALPKYNQAEKNLAAIEQRITERKKDIEAQKAKQEQQQKQALNSNAPSTIPAPQKQTPGSITLPFDEQKQKQAQDSTPQNVVSDEKKNIQSANTTAIPSFSSTNTPRFYPRPLPPLTKPSQEKEQKFNDQMAHRLLNEIAQSTIKDLLQLKNLEQLSNLLNPDATTSSKEEAENLQMIKTYFELGLDNALARLNKKAISDETQKLHIYKLAIDKLIKSKPQEEKKINHFSNKSHR